MTDVDAFLEALVPRQTEAERAIHNGDPAARLAMWSKNDPVTVFGAWVSKRGWSDVSELFE